MKRGIGISINLILWGIILLALNLITSFTFLGIESWLLGMNCLGIGSIGILWYLTSFYEKKINPLVFFKQNSTSNESNNYTDSSL